MGVILQKRDLEILNICYEQMFMSVAQVERYYFKDANKRRARERVLELERSGFIQKRKIYGETSQSILQLTKNGYSIASKQNLLSLRYNPKICLHTVEHDLKLSEVRLRLEELWKGFRWIPERAIRKAEYSEVPDALCIFQSGKTIAIELENSAKSSERILRLLSRWKSENISLALYFVTNSEVFRKYQKIINQHDFEVPIGIIDFQEFIESTPTAWSKNGPIQLFSE